MFCSGDSPVDLAIMNLIFQHLCNNIVASASRFQRVFPLRMTRTENVQKGGLRISSGLFLDDLSIETMGVFTTTLLSIADGSLLPSTQFPAQTRR